jgi:hypothetical protein
VWFITLETCVCAEGGTIRQQFLIDLII